jgi:Zn-dependent protease with chaperone function
MLGMKKLPEVYIVQQNGILNAFAASGLLGKRYAQLNAELVDIAYMENRDFNPVYFVLAHEFAHHYYKHTYFLNKLLISFGRMGPGFGSTLSRAREYSCDRLAQLLTGSDGVREIMILNAGRHLYRYVDLNDYIDSARKEKGIFLRFVNLLSSHPVQVKRVLALADPRRKSGKLF